MSRQKTEFNLAPSPCYYAKRCKGIAEVSKCGRGVCRACAAAMPGVEYRLTPLTKDYTIRQIETSLNMKAAHPSV